jgi:basic membrane lipoprotein Med (substrate-binding protein (PBP1-ABC) superfamily)
MPGVTVRLTMRQWIVVGAVAAVLVAAGLTWWLWPSPKPAEEPLARRYQDVNACLLTDDRGLNSPEAQPVWAGMQDASVDKRVRVQYLTVSGGQTAENAQTFLASLAQGRCSLIFVTGTAGSQAVDRAAAQFPQSRFVLLGRRSGAPNVSTVEGGSPAAVQAAVKQLVATLSS